MRQARPLRPNSSVVEQETTNNGRTNRSAAVFPAQFDALTALIRGLLPGPRPFSGRAGRPEPVSATRQRYHTPRTAGRRLTGSEALAKSPASPRSDGRLFLLELARVAATDHRTPRGPRLWRIPRAQLGEDRWPRLSDAVVAAPEVRAVRGATGRLSTHTMRPQHAVEPQN